MAAATPERMRCKPAEGLAMQSHQDAGLIALIVIVLTILLAHKAGFKPTRVISPAQPATELSSTYITAAATPVQSRKIAPTITTAAILFDISGDIMRRSAA
jgi:hypothetical protein